MTGFGGTSAVRAHLHEIYERHGRLTGALVLESATDPAHPLHTYFEWDDTEAAHRFRLDQAGALIRSVRVVYGPARESVRGFHSVARPEGNTYMPVEEIATDPVASTVLLNQLKRDWLALERRYGHLAAYLDLLNNSAAKKVP